MHVCRRLAAILAIVLMGQSVLALTCAALCGSPPKTDSDACHTGTYDSSESLSAPHHCDRHSFLTTGPAGEIQEAAAHKISRTVGFSTHAPSAPDPRVAHSATDSSPPDALSASHLRIIRATVLRV
jgi:hypothetical protein